jgi:hypothetical protein
MLHPPTLSPHPHPSLLQVAAEFLNNEKSDAQCGRRWNKVLKPVVKKGHWATTEDDVIKNCMDTGVTKWSEIAKRLVSRTPKQCRERYLNHLDPNIRKEPWTQVRS